MQFSTYVGDGTAQWWQTIWSGLGFAFEGIEVSCVKLKYLKMPGFYFYLIFYIYFLWTGLNRKQLDPYLPFMFGKKSKLWLEVSLKRFQPSWDEFPCELQLGHWKNPTCIFMSNITWHNQASLLQLCFILQTIVQLEQPGVKWLFHFQAI